MQRRDVHLAPKCPEAAVQLTRGWRLCGVSIATSIQNSAVTPARPDAAQLADVASAAAPESHLARFLPECCLSVLKGLPGHAPCYVPCQQLLPSLVSWRHGQPAPRFSRWFRVAAYTPPLSDAVGCHRLLQTRVYGRWPRCRPCDSLDSKALKSAERPRCHCHLLHSWACWWCIRCLCRHLRPSGDWRRRCLWRR